MLDTGLSGVSFKQLEALVSLLELAPAYEGIEVQAETYELAMQAAAYAQQPELCASNFLLFLRTCVHDGGEIMQPVMLEELVRTCNVGTILEESLGIVSNPEQRSALITGLLTSIAGVGSADWAVAVLAQAVSMPFPSSHSDAVSQVQACLDLLDAPPSGSASDVAAAVAPALRALLYAPGGGPNLELLHGLSGATRDALMRSLLLLLLMMMMMMMMMMDITVCVTPVMILLAALEQVPVEQRGSALAAGGASALAQLLFCDTGVDQPQLLVSFLEEYVETGSSLAVAVADSGKGSGSRASSPATIQQADWRRLVSSVLVFSKRNEALTRATARVIEMTLAASARPQAGGSVEARLVAETRWVVMEVGAPLLHALRLEPDSWGSDRAAEAAQKRLLDMPTAERRAALCLLLSAASTWPGIEPGTAARALVEVAQLLPMCAADGDLRTTQPLVLAAYREAAGLAASLASATQRDGTDSTIQPFHLDARQLYMAAARSAGVAVSGSSAVASASTVIDLVAACNAAQLPFEAARLALRVLGKLTLDSSIPSSGSRSSGVGRAAAALPLDEQSVAAAAMAVANAAFIFRDSLTVYLALLQWRGTSGVDDAGALQMDLAGVNDPSISEDEQKWMLAKLTDAVTEDGNWTMEEAAAGGGKAGSPIVAGREWLRRMQGHQWRLSSP
ncbi:hypothetical protein FOA52_004442 [Chlamydomonas sp. UWO 241]|nr:hypothetical protein FOA52_004442 [Chlamydomonas sp. UWO 241]